MGLIYGRHPVLEALQSGQRGLHKIFIQSGVGGPAVEQIVQQARAKGIPVEWVDRRRIEQKLGSDPNADKGSDPVRHHQGVVAQASAVAYQDLDDFLHDLPEGAPARLVACDEIQDPQNVGAILRSAGFFGVSGVIVPRWRSAPVGDVAARISSGAIEHVPVLRVKNLAESVRTLQEAGFEVVGAEMSGEPLADFQPGKRWALVLGSEGEGLRRLVKERCDRLLSIRGAGPVSSLNVAAAAAIFLYHLTQK